MSEFSEKFECIHQPLFHWRHNVHGITFHRLYFFHDAVGKNSITEEDTNLYFPNQLPSLQRFLCQSLQVAVVTSHSLSQEKNFLDFKLGRFELLIGSTRYACYSPIGFFPYFAEDIDPVDSLAKFEGIEPVCPVPFKFTEPLLIQPEQNFMVKVFWKNPVCLEHVHSIGVILDGLLYRSIY